MRKKLFLVRKQQPKKANSDTKLRVESLTNKQYLATKLAEEENSKFEQLNSNIWRLNQADESKFLFIFTY